MREQCRPPLPALMSSVWRGLDSGPHDALVRVTRGGAAVFSWAQELPGGGRSVGGALLLLARGLVVFVLSFFEEPVRTWPLVDAAVPGAGRRRSFCCSPRPSMAVIRIAHGVQHRPAHGAGQCRTAPAGSVTRLHTHTDRPATFADHRLIRFSGASPALTRRPYRG